HARGCHQESLGDTVAQVAGFSLVDAEPVHAARRADDLLAKGAVRETRGAHRFGRRSGKSASRPSREALATPRSVMSPVTSRAGVTAKAGLAAGPPAGVSRTCLTTPSVSSPAISATSPALRSSIGMLRPSSIDQSMLGLGAAT